MVHYKFTALPWLDCIFWELSFPVLSLRMFVMNVYWHLFRLNLLTQAVVIDSFYLNSCVIGLYVLLILVCIYSHGSKSDEKLCLKSYRSSCNKPGTVLSHCLSCLYVWIYICISIFMDQIALLLCFPSPWFFVYLCYLCHCDFGGVGQNFKAWRPH